MEVTSSPTTTARWSKAVRVRSSDRPMSSGEGTGRAVRTCRSSRPAWSASAASVRAERSHGSGPFGRPAGADTADPAEPVAPPAVSPEGSGSGASSMTAWALVPLMPKAETPARRSRPGRSQARGRVRSSTEPEAQSTCEEGASTWRVRGMTPWRMAMTILMTPATPAAAWVWPMFDFSEPSHSGRSSGRSWP
ncbi:hypothetical protein M2169_006356 [Streptomyces sp. MJP52]|nr:hypothetical protein [Streptomyces sp. MJP52]